MTRERARETWRGTVRNAVQNDEGYANIVMELKK